MADLVSPRPLWSVPLVRELVGIFLATLPGAFISILDRDLRHLLVAGEAARAAGFDPDALHGRTAAEVLGPEAEPFEANVRGALVGIPFAHEHQHNGRTFLSRGTPLRGTTGDVDAVLVVTTDITEHWQARRDAQHLAEGLQQAMPSRAEIEQAKGILMGLLHVGADKAFELLKTQSQHQNIKVRDLAREIIGRTATRPAPGTGPPR